LSEINGWKETTLGDELTFQRGFDITKKEQSVGKYWVISSSGPASTHSEAKVKGPGVIIGRKGTLGTVFFSQEDYWPHDTTLWIKDFHGNNEKFAYYFLHTMNLEQYDAGASNPSLNRNHIHLLPIRYPVLQLQHKIATILTAYDDLIENNQRRIAILQEMARNLYREWFVHFRFPGHEQAAFRETELGRVPEGWSLTQVGKIATVHRGRSYKSSELADEGGLPFLNLKCINRGGGFRRDGIKRYTGAYKDKQVARPGDIIMAVTDMTQERRIVAHPARVPNIGESISVISMDLVRVEPNNPIPQAYLYGLLMFSNFPETVRQYANGAKVLHLNPDRIEEHGFFLPPRTIMNRFAEYAENIFSLVDSLQLKNENLRRTRDLMLPRLVSGEIDVSELEMAGVEELAVAGE
jgi:type I restriction enzyme, S subunit